MTIHPCKKYKENAIPCSGCEDGIGFSCYEERDFNCMHFDGKDCRGPLYHKDCGEDFDCSDYEEAD